MTPLPKGVINSSTAVKCQARLRLQYCTLLFGIFLYFVFIPFPFLLEWSSWTSGDSHQWIYLQFEFPTCGFIGRSDVNSLEHFHPCISKNTAHFCLEYFYILCQFTTFSFKTRSLKCQKSHSSGFISHFNCSATLKIALTLLPEVNTGREVSRHEGRYIYISEVTSHHYLEYFSISLIPFPFSSWEETLDIRRFTLVDVFPIFIPSVADLMNNLLNVSTAVTHRTRSAWAPREMTLHTIIWNISLFCVVFHLTGRRGTLEHQENEAPDKRWTYERTAAITSGRTHGYLEYFFCAASSLFFTRQDVLNIRRFTPVDFHCTTC